MPHKYILIGSIALSMAACTTNTVMESPDSDARRQARLQLVAAADEVRQSAMALKALRAAQTPYTPPGWIKDPRLHRTVTIDWKGPLMPLLEALGQQADLMIFSKGVASKIPVFVQVQANERRVGDVLADIDLQIYPQAKLLVDTEFGVVEVHYEG